MVSGLTAACDLSAPRPAGRVRGRSWWVVEGEQYLGSIARRYEPADFLDRRTRWRQPGRPT